MSSRISDGMKKSIEKVDHISSDLDERCRLLLVFFSIFHTQNPNKTYGFNELCRKLDEMKRNKAMKTGLTRRTLSAHLKHLLEKDLIEVREEKESSLKIKPRKYRLSKSFVELTRDLRPLEILYSEELLKECRREETEPLTILLLRAYMRLCVEIFRKTLAFPEIYGTIFRDQIYGCIENLTKAHRTIVLERKEAETALRIVEELGDFVKQELNEKYGPL